MTQSQQLAKSFWPDINQKCTIGVRKAFKLVTDMPLTLKKLQELYTTGKLKSNPVGGSKNLKYPRRYAGCSQFCVLRKLEINRPDLYKDVIDGKYVKTRKYDGETIIDLTAAQVAAGWLMTENSVYVLVAKGTLRYKIGWGKRLRRRIEVIRNASPFPIEEVFQIKCDDPQKMEKAIHKKFDFKRCYREWFELSDDDLLHIKSLSR